MLLTALEKLENGQKPEGHMFEVQSAGMHWSQEGGKLLPTELVYLVDHMLFIHWGESVLCFSAALIVAACFSILAL